MRPSQYFSYFLDTCVSFWDRDAQSDKVPNLVHLEPRVLYDASPIAAAIVDLEAIESVDVQNDPTELFFESPAIDSTEVFTGLDESKLDRFQNSSFSADNLDRHLVVIDQNINDFEIFVSDLESQYGNLEFDLLMIDKLTDGIVAITNALEVESRYEAVHIVSHGREGEVHLGNARINTENLAGYTSYLENWAYGLSETADVLFYGCDVGAGSEGIEFITQFSDSTSLDVAASNDLTGNQEKGGDWIFEVTTGLVTAQQIFSSDLKATYQSTLDITSDLVAHYNFDSSPSLVVIDTSGNSNHGVLNDSGARTEDSIVGNSSLDFSNDPIASNVEVIIADTPAVDFGTDDFSIAFWFKTQTPTVTTQILGQTNGTDGFEFQLTDTGNLLFTAGGTTTIGSGGFADNMWHHTTVVRTGNTIEMLIDGTSVISGGYSGSVNSNELFKIGGNSGAPFGGFDGSIDDLRIYQRSLGNSDINELINLSFIDTDNDGEADNSDLDDDNDGILDSVETNDDFDNDGLANSVDLDSDNDGIADNIEAQLSAGYLAPNNGVDGDGVDTAYSGLPAGGLLPVDSDLDGNYDYLDTDSDNDGLSDRIEAGLSGLAGPTYSDPNGDVDDPTNDLIDHIGGSELDFRESGYLLGHVFETSQGGLGINTDGGDNLFLDVDDPSFYTTLQLTMEFQVSDLQNTGIASTLFSNRSGTDATYFKINSDGSLSFSGDSTSLTFGQLFDGRDHSVGFTFDAATGLIQFYLDGELVETVNGSSQNLTGDSFVFGQSQDAGQGSFDPNQAFKGTIKDIRVFNEIRSPAEFQSSYRSDTPYDEVGLIANWNFDSLTIDHRIENSVDGNRLTVDFSTDAGFINSEPKLTIEATEKQANGTVVAHLKGIDSERESAIENILSSHSDLFYAEETGKFYQFVTVNQNWNAAQNNANISTLQGISGQLAQINSALENKFVTDILNFYSASKVYLGGSDSDSEGTWNWQDAGSENTFWFGDNQGDRVGDSFANWGSGGPFNVTGNEDFLLFDAVTNSWQAVNGNSLQKSLIEFDADLVLGSLSTNPQNLTFSIISQSVPGAFAIDSESGDLSIADSLKLDADSLSNHSIVIEIEDIDGEVIQQTLTVQINDVYSAAHVSDLSAGVSLNHDGGNNAYLTVQSTGSPGDIGNVLGGLNELTLEIDFLAKSKDDQSLFSYSATSPTGNDLAIQLEKSGGFGNLSFELDGLTATTTGVDFTELLLDGDKHSLAVSWENLTGQWQVYVDGQLVFADNGFAIGRTIQGDASTGQVVLGQHQTSLAGGFSPDNIFRGTYYDIRIWDDVRSVDEIRTNSGFHLDADAIPSGLIANWQMTEFDSSGKITDVVGGNDLAQGSLTNPSFTPSLVNDSLEVDENATNGTTVGFIRTAQVGFAELGSDPLFTDGASDASPQSFPAGSTLGSWSVESGTVETLGGYIGPAVSGGIPVQIGDGGEGILLQNLSTESGKTYQVSFLMTGDFSNGGPVRNVSVTASGTEESFQVFEPDTFNPANPFWTTQTFTFIADGNSTDLRFQSFDEAVISEIRIVELNPSISSVLAENPDLDFDATTGKFYRTASLTQNWFDALSDAKSQLINGIGGNLVTINSAHENNILLNYAHQLEIGIWLNGTDTTTEGEWFWQTDSGDGIQLWTGGAGGTPTAYSNFNAPEPNGGTTENHLVLRFPDGGWNDLDGSLLRSYVIQWDANEVISNVSYQLSDSAGGRFQIDSNTGEVTVADESSLDFEENHSHDIVVEVTDAFGNSYNETFSIAINDQASELTVEVPNNQSLAARETFKFSLGTGSQILISDQFPGDAILQLDLSVENGILNLGSNLNVTVIAGADGSDQITIEGLEADLNSAIDGLIYTPTPGYSGTDEVIVEATLGNLQGHYDFEKSDASDSSRGAAQDGTLENGAIVINDPVRGRVVRLDGSASYVELPDLFDEPQNLTLSAWVNLNAGASNGEIFSLGNDVVLRADYTSSSGGLHAAYQSSSGFKTMDTGSFIAGTGWHHVALTIDGTNQTQKIFLDGQLISQAYHTEAISYTSGDVSTLGRHAAGGFLFDGMLDDARVYDRALGHDEIVALSQDAGKTTQTVEFSIQSNQAPSFDTSLGYLIQDVGGSVPNNIVDTTIQADGKIVALGNATSAGDQDLVVYRFNADGSLDPTFGTGGIRTLDIGSTVEIPSQLSIQSDGKIVLAGTVQNANNDIVVVRLNTDGSYDTSFGGGDGVEMIDNANNLVVESLELLDDGKILIGGAADDSGLLIRLDSFGNIDSGSPGSYFIVGLGQTESVLSTFEQNDGKLLVAGQSYNAGSGISQWFVGRVASGSFDPTFGVSGQVIATFPGYSSAVAEKVIGHSDGSLFVAGTVTNGSDSDFIVAKYDSDGNLNTSFGGGTGFAIVDLGSTTDELRDFTIQADGKLILLGDTDSKSEAVVVRLESDGTIDHTFGTGGSLFVAAGSNENSFQSIAIGNQEIIAAGFTNSTVTNALIASIDTNDGSLNREFGAETTLDESLIFNEGGISILIDSDVEVYDPELSTRDNFGGSGLTIQRIGGPNSEDIFNATGNLDFDSGVVKLANVVKGTVTQTGGVLSLEFDDGVTNDEINEIVSSLGYQNTNQDPPGSVTLQWSFSDDISGGPDALSATDTITITINPLNNAPTLDNSGDLSLTSVAEDETNPAGDTIADILASDSSDPIADVDDTAEGIAIFSVDNSNGTWQYQLAGSIVWNDFGTVAVNNAVLLNQDASIRFVPHPNFEGNGGEILFYAWDQSSGSDGQTGADVTHRGGTTAFSSTQESATVEVVAINDAPILGLSGPVIYNENASSIPIAPTASLSDIDSANLDGGLLSVSFSPATDVDDRLGIFAVGNGPGQVNRVGNQVFYSGTEIGSVSGGNGADPLVILFNANADLVAVESTIQAISYQNLRNSSLGPRTFQISLSDGDGAAAVAGETISIHSINDGPIVTGLGGESVFAVNDGTPIAIDSGPPAVVSDPESAANFDLGFIRLAGLDFDTNDQLRIDTSGSVRLVSGFIDGSVVEVSGIAIGALSGTSNSTFTILFNSNANTSTVETLISAFTFDSTSMNDGARTIEVTVNDGDGTANGGQDTSVSTVHVYVGTSEERNITTDEDVAYQFSVSDFNFTGIPTGQINSITINQLPLRGTLELNGSPLSTGDQVSRTDIDSGFLTFTPTVNENGINYSSFDFYVNDGKRTVSVLAGEPTTLTLSGGGLFAADEILSNPNNFGPAGTISTGISVVESRPIIDASYLNQGDILFNGYVPDGEWSIAELNAIDNWILDGGVVIGTSNGIHHDDLSSFYGLTINGPSVAGWAVSDSTHPIMNGPFGSVGPNGTSIETAGVVSYFDSTSLDPSDLILATDATTGEPTIVLRAHGQGYLLLTSDEGIFRSDMTGAGTLSTPNDILAANIFAWATDQAAANDTFTVNINVNPVNDAPQANTESFNVVEDNTLSGSSIIANDTDSESDTLTASLVSGPLNAAAFTLNPDGSFLYEPTGNFNGTDQFVYRVSDGNGGFDEATVTLNVTPVNDVPTTQTDRYTVLPGFVSIIEQGVLSNDFDVDGDSLQALLVSPPSNGSISLSPDGRFIYVPLAGFTGADTFTYIATDGAGNSALTTVTVNVLGVGSTSDGSVATAIIGSNPTTTIEESDAENGEIVTVRAIAPAPPTVELQAAQTAPKAKAKNEPLEFGSLAEIITNRDNAQNILVTLVSDSSYNIVGVGQQRLDDAVSNLNSPAAVFNAKKLWSKLDEQLESATSHSFELDISVGAISVVGTLGYILWALRGGTLMALALTQLPTWIVIDPIPILDSYANENGQSQNNDEFDKSYFE